jgi:hypothetical protein
MARIILPNGDPVHDHGTCAGFTVRIPSLGATRHLDCAEPATWDRVVECCGQRRTRLCEMHAAAGKRNPAVCTVCGNRARLRWERLA